MKFRLIWSQKDTLKLTKYRSCSTSSSSVLPMRIFDAMFGILFLTVHVIASSAVTIQERNPETLLESLSAEELDSLFETTLEDLESQIVQTYERHLENHHRQLDDMESRIGRRRQVNEKTSLLPSFEEDFWHSGVGDIKLDNREILQIESITSHQRILGSIKIEKVFPLDLWNLPAIYLDGSGMAMIVKDGRMVPLLVRNIYTKSLRSCVCSASDSLACDCCVPGACLCKNLADVIGFVCVPCGQESDAATCAAASPTVLKTKAAVGFEYSLDIYDPVEGLQRVIIASNGTTLFFYRFDDDGLRPMQFENDMMTMNFAKPITHLGFGETYVDLHGSIQRKRFLVTFGADESDHQFHSLDVTHQRLKSGLSQMWHASGQDMKVWNSGGRVMVGVLSGKDLLIHEMKENHLHEYHAMHTQTISFEKEVSSWKSFSMNFEDYIMIVSPTLARIYHRNGVFYGYIQDLEFNDGISTTRDICYFSIPSCRDKAVFLTGEGKTLSAYVWNGTAQQIQKAYTTTLNDAVINWSLVSAHTDATGFGPLQVVVSGSLGPMLLEINATLQEIPDPVVLQVKAIHKKIQDLEDEFQRQNAIIERFLDRVNNSVDGKSEVTGPIVVLKGISVNGTLETGKFESGKVFLNPFTTNGTNITTDYLEHLKEHRLLDDFLNELHSKMGSTQLTLEDAVLIDDDRRQLIKGKKTLLGGLTSDTLNVKKMSYGVALDEFNQSTQLGKLLGDVIRHNHTGEIRGHKIITKPLQVGNLNAEYLDNIPVSDLVTTTENGTTIAGATFATLQAKTVLLSQGAKIGGINVSLLPSVNETLPLGHCAFLGNLTSTKISTKSSLIGDVNLKYLNTSALKITGGQVQGPLEFVGRFSVQKAQAKFIMGINTEQFMAETVFIDQPAIVKGTLTIPGIDIRGELHVNGNINDKRFPEAYAVLGDKVIRFANKSFELLEVDFIKMGQEATVDGLLVDNIVTLDTDQHIEGAKEFLGGITVLGNLDVKSKIVDGVRLDELNDSIHDPKLTKNKKFDAIFKGNLSVPRVDYKGSFNDLNLTELAEDIIYGDKSPIIIESAKTFTSGVRLGRAFFASKFNDENLETLVSANKEQVITGEKRFQKRITFTNVTVTGLVDGIDLKNLVKNVLYNDREGQVITGEKTFRDGITSQNIEIKGKVNGVNFKDVVTRDGSQTFTAPQTFGKGLILTLEADHIKMQPPVVISGSNFSELFEKRLNLNSQFNHRGTLTVKAPVIVKGSVITNFVNGRELKPALSNLVFTNEPSVIDSKVEFTNITSFGPVRTKNARGANGISIEHINAGAVHLNSDSVLSGTTLWQDMVLEGGVIGSSLFNGFDLRALNKEAVFIDIPGQVITGKKTFVNGIKVKGNLEAETINGIDLRQRLFSRGTEQTVTAPYVFVNVTVEKSIKISGRFNDIDMRFADTDVLRKQSEITFTGDVVFRNNITVDRLRIGGFLDNIDLARVLPDAVKLNETSLVIEGQKNFSVNPEMPNTYVSYLNGIDFAEYVDHVLLLNKSKTLLGTLTVSGIVTMPEVATGVLVVKGSVDGVDIQKLKNDVLYVNEDRIVNGSIEITGNVYVGGHMNTSYLNGLNLDTDYLTTDTKQNITHNITFENIWTSDVVVSGLVNSWNLPIEIKDTLKNAGGQTVTGAKNFTGPVRVLGNLEVRGKVGTDLRVKLSRQAIRLDEEEVWIEGALIFNNTLSVKHLTSLTNVINGVNYTELCEKVWLVDEPARITGRMVFEADVFFLRGLFYDTSDGKPSVGDLHKESLLFAEEISVKTFAINKQYNNLCDAVVSLNKKLENAIFEGDFFDTVSVQNFNRRRHSSASFQVYNTTYIVISWEDDHCSSTLYSFNSETSRLVEIATIENSGNGNQWLFINNGGNAYLALASSSHSNSCVRANSTIWKLDGNTVTFSQYLDPGERLAVTYAGGGGIKIYMHAVDCTRTYKLIPTTQVFEMHKRTNDIIDIALSLHLEDKTSILFQAHKGYGRVLINGKSGSREELARNIIDAVLFEQNKLVFLAISSVTFIRQKPEHEIKLFSVDTITKSFRWLDHKEVASPANLTSFFAGNQVSGTTFIIVTQSNRFPLVYTVLGEKLQLTAELDIPRVEWVQSIGVPSQRYQAFLDHYVLFGQKDKTQLLTKLIMKGASTPRGEVEDLDCNTQYFSGDSLS